MSWKPNKTVNYFSDRTASRALYLLLQRFSNSICHEQKKRRLTLVAPLQPLIGSLFVIFAMQHTEREHFSRTTNNNSNEGEIMRIKKARQKSAAFGGIFKNDDFMPWNFEKKSLVLLFFSLFINLLQGSARWKGGEKKFLDNKITNEARRGEKKEDFQSETGANYNNSTALQKKVTEVYRVNFFFFSSSKKERESIYYNIIKKKKIFCIHCVFCWFLCGKQWQW